MFLLWYITRHKSSPNAEREAQYLVTGIWYLLSVIWHHIWHLISDISYLTYRIYFAFFLVLQHLHTNYWSFKNNNNMERPFISKRGWIVWWAMSKYEKLWSNNASSDTKVMKMAPDHRRVMIRILKWFLIWSLWSNIYQKR